MRGSLILIIALNARNLIICVSPESISHNLAEFNQKEVRPLNNLSKLGEDQRNQYQEQINQRRHKQQFDIFNLILYLSRNQEDHFIKTNTQTKLSQAHIADNYFILIIVYFRFSLNFLFGKDILIFCATMKFMTILIVFVIMLSISCLAPPQNPVIGIYTQDSSTENFDMTYIAASYFKNIEMAGAQAIPLFYHYSYQQLDDILGKINGVLFPGGQMPITFDNQWTQKAAYILEHATKVNQQGVPYPIWGTCRGFELLMYVTSNNRDNRTVLTVVNGQNHTTEALKLKTNSSVLLNAVNEQELKEMTTDSGIFYFNHRWAVLLQTYERNPKWNSYWNLISTSFTKDGVEFVSTVEAKEYPFYMTQYHPEKNSFEWRVPAKRSYRAISVEQKFINTFMNVARKNPNIFPADELAKKVIYNYKPELTSLGDEFLQVYYFDESNL